MNINNLHVGLVAKNYRDLCRVLEVEPRKDGSGKIAHINELKQFFNFEKSISGHSLTVTEIYSEPKEHIDKRTLGNNGSLKLSELEKDKIPYIKCTYGANLDSIYCNSSALFIWKCSKCNRLFNAPVYLVSRNKMVRCSYCKLSKGARKIRKILDNEIINYKLEFMFDNLISDEGKMLRFDFAIFDYQEKMLGIIEYDGGFHDTDENTIKRDIIKDNYCIDNKIPLLRIHHTEKYSEISVINFLEQIGCEMLFNRNIKIKESSLLKVKENINKLEEELKEMRKYIDEC